MPVDQATLDRYITDVAGDDEELATTLRERLGSKPDAATRFVGGFTRSQDYTQKTQALANDRKQFENAQSDYENRLTQAESEKNKIMSDLANERLTTARATAMLRNVKEAYGLNDNDLPGIGDVQETARTGRVVDSTPDLDERFAKFEQKLMDQVSAKLIPEISSLAIVPSIWNEIAYEHEKLFGKRLTKNEQAEILKDARNSSSSLENVWANKYNVSERRLEVRDEENKKKWRQDWDDERAKRDQELALQGIRPESKEFVLEDRQSPVFRKNFTPKEAQADTNSNVHLNDRGVDRRAETPQHGDAARERMSGADRAAAKFVERARSGQIGKPVEQTRKTA